MNKLTLIILITFLFTACGPSPQIDVSFGPSGIAAEGSGERLEGSFNLDEGGYSASGDGEHIRANARVVCEDDYFGLCAGFGPIEEICFAIPESLGEKLCKPTDIVQ